MSNSNGEWRICSICKKKLPLENFYRQNGHGQFRARCKNCYLKKQRSYRKTAAHRKWRKSPARRLQHAIGQQIRASVKNWERGTRWRDYVKWTMEELIVHLESNFSPKMTWDNYGKWHLDHKRPKYEFDMPTVDSEGFKECWALKNLQPLWGYANQVKGKSSFSNYYFDERPDWEGEEQ